MIAFISKLLTLVAIGTFFFGLASKEYENSYQVKTGNQSKMLIFIVSL